MNSRLLMTVSAFFLLLTGIALSFFPAELALVLTEDPAPITGLILQMLGAAYLGFAILNWMARGILIGGV